MKYGFGVDLGGTTVKIAYFDTNGTMLSKWEIPTVTTGGGQQILPDIAASIRSFLDAHNINETAILGLGIGVLVGAWNGFWVAKMGIPGFIMAGTNCLVQVTCNATLKIYGGDTYIGIMTVINSVREIFSLPVTGLTQGAQPVISFNYGAKEYRRVRSGIAFMSILGAIFTAVCWILVLLFPEALLRLFTTDENLVQLGVKAMHIYFFGFVFMSLQFGGQSTFTALGKAKQAVFFSLLRKAFIVFPLTLLLPRWFGVDGVFLAEPVSNLIGGVACFATMMLTVWPMLVRKEREGNG